MAQKYTKDKLIGELLTHNREVTKHMSNIAASLENINDTNILHANMLNNNNSTIKSMVEVNTSFLKFIRWILVALVAAIIVLAGAEKVLEFIPPFI